ncbi:hypothetical protein [Nocardioides houyundeii]|uniref:hypothetical protein n=1 Tax=Nocardioides houyundeii TaxID=2045452 RepID=UPI000C764CD2|nr:hypothetical protein [Nocardioides houyundeii]
MDDPSKLLTAPQAEPLIPAALDQYLHIGDLISLGHWAMVAIDKMGGPNIPQEVGEWFAGDWSEVSRSADALRKLGQFCDEAAHGVTTDLDTLRVTWDGQAAASASTYFTDLAARLTEQKANFEDIASQYDQTAFGVKEMANAVGGLVESLADWAIAAGISLAAAAASSWTIVGGIAGASGAGYSIYKGAQVIKELLEIRAKVWLACEALLGLIAGSLASVKGFSTVDLPGAYNNTQVPG